VTPPARRRARGWRAPAAAAPRAQARCARAGPGQRATSGGIAAGVRPAAPRSFLPPTRRPRAPHEPESTAPIIWSATRARATTACPPGMRPIQPRRGKGHDGGNAQRRRPLRSARPQAMERPMTAYIQFYLPILAATAGAGIGLAAVIRAACEGAATIIRARRGDDRPPNRQSALPALHRPFLRERRLPHRHEPG